MKDPLKGLRYEPNQNKRWRKRNHFREMLFIVGSLVGALVIVILVMNFGSSIDSLFEKRWFILWAVVPASIVGLLGLGYYLLIGRKR